MSLEIATIDASELAVSYRTQIAQHHEAGKQADQLLLKAGLNKIKIARETGQLILAARSNLSQAEFGFATDFLSAAQVRGYARFVKFAELAENPRAQLTEVAPAVQISLALTGAVQMPQGHGSQTSHDPPVFFSWASHIVMQFKVAWAKYLVAKPMDTWTINEAEQFEYSLRPILKVHQTITQWIKQQ